MTESGRSRETGGSGEGGRSNLLLWIIVVLLALLTVAFAVVLFVLLSDPSAPGEVESDPADSTTTLASEGDFETIEVGVGEPAVAGQFVITVTGAGPPALDPTEKPPEGTYYLVVAVEFENRGETVALNGQPYGVNGTILEAGDESLEGIMQVDFGNPMREGTIPADSTFIVNFIFVVPEQHSDLVFVWTPQIEGYPRIRVEL